MTESNSLLAASSAQASDESATRIAALEAEVSNLLAELDDLTLLYEVTTEHGEAVENQLADANLELQLTPRRICNWFSDASSDDRLRIC
jgi:sigma-B regulation protein RsbU (phosphoserine phosphatase)